MRRGCHDLHDEIRSGKRPLDNLDGKILALSNKYPFESAHPITERLIVAHSAMLQHLHEFLMFKSFPLHWVPHLLTSGLPEKRKEDAMAMLPFLHTAKRDGWHYLVTGNES
jgi:hypothetical protein